MFVVGTDVVSEGFASLGGYKSVELSTNSSMDLKQARRICSTWESSGDGSTKAAQIASFFYSCTLKGIFSPVIKVLMSSLLRKVYSAV